MRWGECGKRRIADRGYGVGSGEGTENPRETGGRGWTDRDSWEVEGELRGIESRRTGGVEKTGRRETELTETEGKEGEWRSVEGKVMEAAIWRRR